MLTSSYYTAMMDIHMQKTYMYMYNLFNKNTYIITLSRGSPILNK